MSGLQVFQNPAFGSVRVTTIDGEPWFVAADVCKALEIGNSRQAVTRLDDDERNTVILNDGIRGNPNVTVINEPGLYGLALSSRKKEARDFKRWIKHEVLPAIRKHGAYMTPEALEAALLNPDTLIRLATELKAEREQKAALQAANAQLTESNAALQAEIASFAPVRKYVDEILSSTGTMTTTQIAADYSLSAYKLNKILHEEKIQHKVNGQWILYQSHMGKGYTQSVTIPITRANGSPDAKMHTQWTQKGRLMIHDILSRRGVRANMDKAG